MRLDEFGQLKPESCYWCALQIHDECFNPVPVNDSEFRCCCKPESLELQDVTDGIPGVGRSSGRERGGQVKDVTEITDVTSTGRKRAAMLYPIFPGQVCEWSGLKAAGGGVEPIIGCDGNLIFPSTKDGEGGDLHHGPDKNTLNNDPRNVHRICKSCHHAWHARNDRYYGKRPPGDEPFLPVGHTWVQHDSASQATPLELAGANEGREAQNPQVIDPHRRGVIPFDERI